MTVKDIIGQIEYISGRQPESYMMRLINDGLNEISAKKQHYTVSNTTDLEVKKRWYELSDQVIDIIRVEVKDTDGRYVMIPKLADPHTILKNDTDAANDTLV
jgi:hypothetical protein